MWPTPDCLWVTWPDPVSPLKKELTEYPELLLTMLGVSATPFSVLWLDSSVSLTDQEIPEETGGEGELRSLSQILQRHSGGAVLLPTGSPLQLNFCISSSSLLISTMWLIWFTACLDSLTWQQIKSTWFLQWNFTILCLLFFTSSTQTTIYNR